MTHQIPRDEIVQAAVQRARVEVMDFASHRKPARSRRFRVGIALGAASFLVAGSLATAGASALLATASDRSDSVLCFPTASTNGDPAETIVGDASTTTEADVLTACGYVWSIGKLSDEPVSGDSDTDFAVPELAACRLNDGVSAAFPVPESSTAEELCGLLGLAEWRPVSEGK